MKMTEILQAKAKAAVVLRDELILLANRVEAETTGRLAVLGMKLDRIEECLKGFGLTIEESSLTTAKTGMNPNVWGAEDRLRVEFNAVPSNGSCKFKFLSFRGYDATGRSKNHARREEKAQIILQALKEASGLSSVQVNSSCLELREEDSRKRVMVSLWI